MTALSDIRAGIIVAKNGPSRARLFGSTPRFKVRVGKSAERSVCCDFDDNSLPHMIDGCVVERTDQFDGWDVVEL